MAISIGQIIFEVTAVTDVIVTDPAQDPDVGDWVRDIRVFSGADTEKIMVLQVTIRSTGKQELELTAPTQQF